MKMVSIWQKRVIFLTSGRRDQWLSSDLYPWLQIKAHISLQAPLVTVHKGLLCISESPCQSPGPAHLPTLPITCCYCLRFLDFCDDSHFSSLTLVICAVSLLRVWPCQPAFLFLSPGLFQMHLAVFPLIYTIKSYHGVVLLAVSLLMITDACTASPLPTVLVWFLFSFLSTEQK